MTTEDITITHTEGWRAFVMTGTKIIVSVIRGNGILYRFGITSTSAGSLLKPEDTVLCDETIYIKDISGLANNSVITITTG